VSLAHHGVLFLDELLEFQQHVLETLRQPLEDGYVIVARARLTVRFPARFMLVAACNPCPCGYLNSPLVACRCSEEQLRRYQGRLSGPLMDRIDLHVELPPVSYEALRSVERGESSAVVRARVRAAWERQLARRSSGGGPNSRLDGPALRRICRLEPHAESRLQKAVDVQGMSARGYTRVLRVARTIADLDGADAITDRHVREALILRLGDASSEVGQGRARLRAV
jgi:magnesium chelatase family protein